MGLDLIAEGAALRIDQVTVELLDPRRKLAVLAVEAAGG